ncbi:MAG: hypothetical protein ABI968_11145 [Acidobacteriota bacterium]
MQEVPKRSKVIAVIAFVAIIALFSACTAVVSHERESIARAAAAGSTSAQFLLAGSNFWSRYFMFLIIAFLSLGLIVRRLLMELGRW